MLVWLAFYLVGVLFLPSAAWVCSALGCLGGTLLVGRGTPLFGRVPPRARYSAAEYGCVLGILICGCALLSFAVALLLRLCGAETGTATATGGTVRALLLSCLVPACFEELLLRGRVLGLLREARGGGVWLCALLFALMHADLARLPYALFAGVVLTATVYLSGNLYLGMLLHFLTNAASLLLQRIPDAAAGITAALLLLVFCFCAFFLRKTRIFADAKALLGAVRPETVTRAANAEMRLYIAAMLALCVLRIM